MSVEGLWAVEFGHVGANFQPVNAGIAVLESQRVFGGDSWFAYTGEYSTAGEEVMARLRVKRHKDDPNSIDAWNSGDNDFSAELRITLQSQTAGQGVMTRSGMQLGVRLRKLAELP